MKKFLLAALAAALLPAMSFGQEDIDIEIGFDNFMAPTTIVTGIDMFTTDGTGIVAGEFEELFGNDLETDNPGFITPATEGETERFNPFDEIRIAFLDASAHATGVGEGFVTFFNPDTGGLEVGNSSIAITNVNDETTTLDGGTLSGDSSLFLSLASDGNQLSNAADPDENEILGLGEVHNHLNFNLDDATQATGAYGILLQVEADIADAAGEVDGVVDFTSDKFFLIFNNGLTEEQFLNEALPAFGLAAVPEPAAGFVLTALAGAMLTRRRRRI